jgi:hypothetical protein
MRPLLWVGLAFVLCGIICTKSVWAQQEWSFAAISDIQSGFSSYLNVLNEIKTPTVGREIRGKRADFILVLGDLSPVSVNFSIFQKTFENTHSLFFPARGNHESNLDVRLIEAKILPAAASFIQALNRFSKSGLSYWFDWRNARLIILDQYADFKRSGANPKALQWLSQAIESAASVDHVFLGFHEPFFPWDTEQDPFWGILLKHRPRVRALFFGHTHIYHRTRFPELLEGIPVINVGNAGQNTHSDMRQTIVCVSVDGHRARVTTVQTPDGKSNFRVADAFELNGP